MSADLPTAGRLIGNEHWLAIRVYFEDTDLSGVVYHANYLRYMERGRSDMLSLLGVDQRSHFEATGEAFAISHLTIAYKGPARLDDALLITSRAARIGAASVDIQQRVMREGLLLAEGRVTAALVNRNGRPVRQPDDWRRRFHALTTMENDTQ